LLPAETNSERLDGVVQLIQFNSKIARNIVFTNRLIMTDSETVFLEVVDQFNHDFIHSSNKKRKFDTKPVRNEPFEINRNKITEVILSKLRDQSQYSMKRKSLRKVVMKPHNLDKEHTKSIFGDALEALEFDKRVTVDIDDVVTLCPSIAANTVYIKIENESSSLSDEQSIDTAHNDNDESTTSIVSVKSVAISEVILNVLSTCSGDRCISKSRLKRRVLEHLLNTTETTTFTYNKEKLKKLFKHTLKALFSQGQLERIGDGVRLVRVVTFDSTIIKNESPPTTPPLSRTAPPISLTSPNTDNKFFTWTQIMVSLIVGVLSVYMCLLFSVRTTNCAVELSCTVKTGRKSQNICMRIKRLASVLTDGDITSLACWRR
jgi:hypothetical protein